MGETSGSTKVSGIDKAKDDGNAQKVLLNEKITSVKVSSPMAQEMIEDTIDVAAKAVIENDNEASEKYEKAKDTDLEKSEQDTNEEVKEEAKDEPEPEISTRRRGRSLVSPQVTPLKKKKNKSPEEPSAT